MAFQSNRETLRMLAGIASHTDSKFYMAHLMRWPSELSPYNAILLLKAIFDAGVLKGFREEQQQMWAPSQIPRLHSHQHRCWHPRKAMLFIGLTAVSTQVPT